MKNIFKLAILGIGIISQVACSLVFLGTAPFAWHALDERGKVAFTSYSEIYSGKAIEKNLAKTKRPQMIYGRLKQVNGLHYILADSSVECFFQDIDAKTTLNKPPVDQDIIFSGFLIKEKGKYILRECVTLLPVQRLPWIESAQTAMRTREVYTDSDWERENGIHIREID